MIMHIANRDDYSAKQKTFVCSCLCCFLLMHTVMAQRVVPSLPKMPPEPLQADIRLLKKILETNHPSLYWFTPKDSIDGYFNAIIRGITDSLNELQFRNKVAWLVAKIKCGHTTVRFSKAYGKISEQYRFPQFPLALKAWDDSLVVLGSAYSNDSIFKRGVIVTGINGKKPLQLLDTLHAYISTDGNSINYKNQLISTNFPGWYKIILGNDDTAYAIQYMDSTGKETSTVLKAFNPPADTTGKRREAMLQPDAKILRKQLRKARLLNKRALFIDTALGTAFIRLATFTGGGLKRFFRKSFRTIDQLQLKNLVIDIRENGGGNVNNSVRLTQYLLKEPFKVGDSVVAISRKFTYGKYIKSSLLYWITMNLSARRMPDGFFHYRKYETHLYQPRDKYHFDGNVYLIQGGFTFSAATMFVASLKGQSNITVVGEETGGGYYGNSAMHIPTISLPHTGLRINLPMYRLVMDATRLKGRGIMPDIEIKPSSNAIRQGIDLKMETVRSMIQQKRMNTE